MARTLTDAEYKARLAEFGKVEALERFPYNGIHTKLLHRCLVCGNTKKIKPVNTLCGHGLGCKHPRTDVEVELDEAARIARKGEESRERYEIGLAKKRQRGREKYEARLAEFGRVELIGEYLGRHTPTLHRCLVHGEEHKTRPADCIKGRGLKCCRLGGDTRKRLSSDPTWANSSCHIYLAKVNGKYLKPGIAVDLEQRVKNDRKKFYTGYDFVSPVMTRAGAWAIEQSLLRLSAHAKPEVLEPEYSKWAGRTELRLKTALPAHWYVEKFHELVEELAEIGWEDLYLKYQTQTLT